MNKQNNNRLFPITLNFDSLEIFSRQHVRRVSLNLSFGLRNRFALDTEYSSVP